MQVVAYPLVDWRVHTALAGFLGTAASLDFPCGLYVGGLSLGALYDRPQGCPARGSVTPFALTPINPQEVWVKQDGVFWSVG